MGDHRVVWWDPAALHLDRQDEVGLRQQRILAADDSMQAANEGTRLHAEWQSRRAGLLLRGAVPSVNVSTVTDLKERHEIVSRSAVQHVATESARAGRPHGKRFGVLVHAVLATVDLLADPEQVTKVARAEGRLVSASVEEIDAAAGAVAVGAPPFTDRARCACQHVPP